MNLSRALRLALWGSLFVFGLLLSFGVFGTPQHGIRMANSFLTISMVAYEQLRVLFNELKFTRKINRQYDPMFAVTGAKVGTTVNARKPPRYIVDKGQAVGNINAMTETPVPVTLTDQAKIVVEASTADFALSIDDFSHRFIRPAAIALANQMDFDGLSRMTQNVSNFIGTPGTNITTYAGFLPAKTMLDVHAVPRADRWVIFSPSQEENLVGGLTTFLNPEKEISEQYLQGSMGRAGGFSFDMDQNIITQTTGVMAAGASAVKVNGVNQSGSSLITNGWTAGDILNAGDIVACASTHSVNPQNRTSTGKLLNLVCTATQTADGSGNMTIPIATDGDSGIVAPGNQFANCDVLPTTNDVVSVYGTVTPSGVSNKSSAQGLAFHPDFCTLVVADLPVYEKGVVESFRLPAPELGFSGRVIKAYNVMTDQLIVRLDFLYGWALLYRELACRIATGA